RRGRGLGPARRPGPGGPHPARGRLGPAAELDLLDRLGVHALGVEPAGVVAAALLRCAAVPAPDRADHPGPLGDRAQLFLGADPDPPVGAHPGPELGRVSYLRSQATTAQRTTPAR